MIITSPKDASQGRLLPLPLFSYLMVKDRPRVCQLRQSGQMLEALDRGRGGILRKTRGIKAARAVDFPEGTPKAFRGLITRVRSCAAFKILNLAPRGRLVRR